MTSAQRRMKNILWLRWTGLYHQLEMRDIEPSDEAIARFTTAFYTYRSYLRRIGVQFNESPYLFLVTLARLDLP